MKFCRCNKINNNGYIETANECATKNIIMWITGRFVAQLQDSQVDFCPGTSNFSEGPACEHYSKVFGLQLYHFFIGCNLSEVQGIGVGIRVAGKYYNSVHGIIVGENLTFAYQNFKMFVRSRPWIG